jgi:hypothetical protein
MSTETNALSAVEKETPEKQLTQCRKIIVAVEKGDTHLAARLFEALRKMLRSIEKSKSSSSDEKLEALGLLTRLKKANRGADQAEDASSVATATSNPIDSEHRSIDMDDIWRVLGPQYTRYREPLKRIERDTMLAEFLGAEPEVSSVQRLILDLRRPEPGGTRLMNFTIVFNAAKNFLAEHDAEELPREQADFEYERNEKTFEQRMRERGVGGKLV